MRSLYLPRTHIDETLYIHTRASAHRFKKFHARVIGVGIDFPFFHSHKGQSTFGVSDSRNFTYLSDWKKADHTMGLRLF